MKNSDWSKHQINLVAILITIVLIAIFSVGKHLGFSTLEITYSLLFSLLVSLSCMLAKELLTTLLRQI